MLTKVPIARTRPRWNLRMFALGTRGQGNLQPQRDFPIEFTPEEIHGRRTCSCKMQTWNSLSVNSCKEPTHVPLPDSQPFFTQFDVCGFPVPGSSGNIQITIKVLLPVSSFEALVWSCKVDWTFLVAIIVWLSMVHFYMHYGSFLQ